jgi:sterol desaturase/sphingolipid hydroxylase (fatty acid hydroxylase superfamily)
VVSIAGAYVLLFVAEQLLPLRRRTHPLGARLFVNFVMSAATFLAGTIVVRSVALRGMSVVTQGRYGVLQLGPMPTPARVAVAFLLMDLTFYYWHRLNHVVGFFWRFHLVHHVDPDMDVSTSFRFHFGEVLYSSAFRLAQVLLIGVTPLLYGTYELVFQLATLFHHSNLRLPIGVERALNRVLVTPRMHGIHHSDVQEESNTNYSVVFRWWDALHRTLRLNVSQSALRIGVAGRRRPGDNRVCRLLTMPVKPLPRAEAPHDGTPRADRGVISADGRSRLVE